MSEKWTSLWRLPIFIAIWIGFTVINIPAILLGLIVIPLMYRYRGTLYGELPAWTRPWANPEDWEGGFLSYAGSLPKFWVERNGISFWSFYWYHAIRNPANGLRSFEFLDLDIDPSRVRFYTPQYYRYYAEWYMRKEYPDVKTYWHVTWQGWQAVFDFSHHWSDDRYFNIKIGWRVSPDHAVEPQDLDDLRIRDASFATKLLVYRKG